GGVLLQSQARAHQAVPRPDPPLISCRAPAAFRPWRPFRILSFHFQKSLDRFGVPYFFLLAYCSLRLEKRRSFDPFPEMGLPKGDKSCQTKRLRQKPAFCRRRQGGAERWLRGV